MKEPSRFTKAARSGRLAQKRPQKSITASKTLEATLRATQSGLEKHIAEQDVKLEQAGAETGKEGLS